MSEQSLCTTDVRQPDVQRNSQTDANSQERRPVFRPRVDLIDSAQAVILWADLPGADENSLDITIEKNTLTLKATVQPPEFPGMKPALREYAVGNYERGFTLSEEIDRERIEATITQGVLKLVLPKTQESAMRKVTVKAG